MSVQKEVGLHQVFLSILIAPAEEGVRFSVGAFPD